MKVEINEEELSGGHPIEMSILRETADRLFSDKAVRFVFHGKEDELPKTMLIVVAERLTLWFFNREGNWKYDGWEMGDYSDYWKEGNL